MTRGISTLLRCGPWLASGGALFVLALDLTLRDRIPVLATIWYAAPPAVLAIGLLLAGVVAFVQERYRVGLVCAVVLSLCGAAHRHDHQIHPAPLTRSSVPIEPSGGVTGLLWNVQGGRRGWGPIAREIARHDPDVVCLIEPLRRYGDGRLQILELLPEHRCVTVGKSFVLFVRGDAELISDRKLDGARVASIRVRVREEQFVLLPADLVSSPLRPRKPMLRAVHERVRPFEDEPALLLGDFNTPRRSVWFDDLRQRWEHAFEDQGLGETATWPDPLPVLSIDHVWFTSRVWLYDCQIVRSSASDHYPVLFSFFALPEG